MNFIASAGRAGIVARIVLSSAPLFIIELQIAIELSLARINDVHQLFIIGSHLLALK